MSVNLQYAVGLDLSFKSSGLTIYSFQQNHWYCYGFAQWVREINAHYLSEDVTIKLFPPFPKQCTDTERYEHTCHFILQTLCACVPKEFRSREFTRGFIEHYVFHANPQMRGNNYKLQENGGIIKHALYTNGFTGIDNMVNSTWKAQVIGNGRASKLETVQFIAQNGPCVNMLHFCGYLNEDELLLNKKGQKIVPSPCQDLADSAALCMAVFYTRPKLPKKKQTKKTKEYICIEDDKETTQLEYTGKKPVSFWSSSALNSNGGVDSKKICQKQPLLSNNLQAIKFSVLPTYSFNENGTYTKIQPNPREKTKKSKVIPMQTVKNLTHVSTFHSKKEDAMSHFVKTSVVGNNKSKDNMLLQKRPLLQVTCNNNAIFLKKKQKTTQSTLDFSQT